MKRNRDGSVPSLVRMLRRRIVEENPLDYILELIRDNVLDFQSVMAQYLQRFGLGTRAVTNEFNPFGGTGNYTWVARYVNGTPVYSGGLQQRRPSRIEIALGLV